MLTVTDIDLNRLKPSPRNLRKTGQARIDPGRPVPLPVRRPLPAQPP